MTVPADELAAKKFSATETAYRPLPADSPLRTQRRLRRLTLAEVSAAVGVSMGYLSQIEVGKHEPSLDVARKLAAFFGVTMDELFPAVA